MGEVGPLAILAMTAVLQNPHAPNFRQACEFLRASGLAPQRLSVQYIGPNRYNLRFYLRDHVHPMQFRFESFRRILQYLARLDSWLVLSIELISIPFEFRNIVVLERAMNRLDPELILVYNCTYPDVAIGEQTLRLNRALGRRRLSFLGGQNMADRVRKSEQVIQGRRAAVVNQAQQVNQPIQQDGVAVGHVVPQIDDFLIAQQADQPIQQVGFAAGPVVPQIDDALRP